MKSWQNGFSDVVFGWPQTIWILYSFFKYILLDIWKYFHNHKFSEDYYRQCNVLAAKEMPRIFAKRSLKLTDPGHLINVLLCLTTHAECVKLQLHLSMQNVKPWCNFRKWFEDMVLKYYTLNPKSYSQWGWPIIKCKKKKKSQRDNRILSVVYLDLLPPLLCICFCGLEILYF